MKIPSYMSMPEIVFRIAKYCLRAAAEIARPSALLRSMTHLNGTAYVRSDQDQADIMFLSAFGQLCKDCRELGREPTMAEISNLIGNSGSSTMRMNRMASQIPHNIFPEAVILKLNLYLRELFPELNQLDFGQLLNYAESFSKQECPKTYDVEIESKYLELCKTRSVAVGQVGLLLENKFPGAFEHNQEGPEHFVSSVLKEALRMEVENKQPLVFW